MGLFRALIVVAVGSFILSVINDNKKMRSIPIIGKTVDKKVKDKKDEVIIAIENRA